MKSKIVTLKPGTILCWKDYSIFRILWSKLTKKSLSYNRFAIITDPKDFITFSTYTSIAYEPVKAYTQKELQKLTELVKKNADSDTFEDIKVIIDAVRPNTLKKELTLDNCKYYKKIDLNANAIEYIYEVE